MLRGPSVRTQITGPLTPLREPYQKQKQGEGPPARPYGGLQAARSWAPARMQRPVWQGRSRGTAAAAAAALGHTAGVDYLWSNCSWVLELEESDRASMLEAGSFRVEMHGVLTVSLHSYVCRSVQMAGKQADLRRNHLHSSQLAVARWALNELSKSNRQQPLN